MGAHTRPARLGKCKGFKRLIVGQLYCDRETEHPGSHRDDTECVYWIETAPALEYLEVGPPAMVPGSTEWVTAPDGEEFRVGACQGHAACPVERHVHGCFADDGANCDHPEDHPGSNEPPQGWFVFGTHVDTPGPLEFSEALDDGGMPKWERPVPGSTEP